MAAESIITYKKLVHPAYRVSDKSVRTDIDYIGPYSTLFATLTSELLRGQPWGDYPGLVSDIDIRSIEGTSSPVQGELSVSVEYETTDGAGDFGIDPGIESGTVYEIDWTVIVRNLLEHPAFAEGSGQYDLTDEDKSKIKEWENENDAAAADALLAGLGTSATKYASLINSGVTTWEDYAPIATKTTTYTGGPGSFSEAGMKDTPTGFPNLPTGYEWIKSADRSLRSGTRDKWDRTEQWLGCVKVLVDRNNIY